MLPKYTSRQNRISRIALDELELPALSGAIGEWGNVTGDPNYMRARGEKGLSHATAEPAASPNDDSDLVSKLVHCNLQRTRREVLTRMGRQGLASNR